eukprot:TRINITY_DN3001_c0_g1_i1.p1 TRINITY_DN3001_c0_g1~~TRINITY_DN3001_c0_g1_i1.p1  ORF type:complete len:1706 (+),score=582.50 TRINITY_DN3001_c0_g1_i1:72-5189(+)
MANSTEWWAIQAKVFSRWCEQHLKKRSLSLESAGGIFGGGFDDGLLLWNLVAECTEQTPPRINKKPKFRIQKISNIATTLNFLKGQNVKLVNIAGEDILSRNRNLTLGLIWTLIMKYQVETKSGSENARSDLLNWLNSVGIPCKNFTTDWQDGANLVALVNVVGSKSTSPSGNALNDIAKSMDIADKELGISPILDPSDMVSANADERSNMTYLSFFRDLWVKTHGNETPSAEDIASLKNALRNAEKDKREKEELELQREEKEKKDEAEKKKKKAEADEEAQAHAQREAQMKLQEEEEAKKLLAEKAKKEQEEQEAARAQAEKEAAEAKARQQQAREKAEQAEKEAALLAEAKKKEEADKIARDEKAKKAAEERLRNQEAAAAQAALAKAKEEEEAKARKEMEEKAAMDAEQKQKLKEAEEKKKTEEEEKKKRQAAAQKELEEKAAKEAAQKQKEKEEEEEKRKQKQKIEEEKEKKKKQKEKEEAEAKAQEAAAAEAALVAKERQELENEKLQAAAKAVEAARAAAAAAAAPAPPLSIRRVGEDGRDPVPNVPSTLVFTASDPAGGDVQLVYSLQDQNGTVLSQNTPLDEKSPGIFEVSVTPPSPGKYTLTVTSPSNPTTPPQLIELVVAPPAEVDVKSASPLAEDGTVPEGNTIECEVGRPAVVTVDIHNADPELVVVDLTDPAGNEVQCSAERDDKGEWKLRFLPTVAGAHTVIINLDGVPLTSPFTVNVLKSPDDNAVAEASKKLAQAQKQLANQSGSQNQPAKKLKAEGQGQRQEKETGEGEGGEVAPTSASPFQLVVGDLATLRFLLERVGDSVLRVQVDEPAHPGLTLPDLAYQQLPDGRYDIRFTPHHAGPHIISLLLDNLPIEGTPITLNCREGDVAAGPRVWDTKPTLTPLASTPTTFSPAQAGDRVVVQSFKCVDFLPGQLAAIITDSSNARVPTQIVVNSATNSLDVMCWPTLAGAHKMDLKLLNEPLEGSTGDFTVVFGGDDADEEVAPPSPKKRRKKHKKELLTPSSSSGTKKKKRKSSKRSHSRTRSRDKNSDEREKKRGSKKGGKKDKDKKKEKEDKAEKETVANASDDVKAESLFELPALHLDVSSLSPSIDGPIGVHLGGTLEEGANGAISLRFMAPRVGTYNVQIHDENDTPLLDVPVDLVIERSGLAQQKVHVPEIVNEGGLRVGLKPFSDLKGRLFETELSDIAVSVVPSTGLNVEIGTEGDAYAVTFMPTESAEYTVSMTVFGEPLLQEDLIVKTSVFKPEVTITQQSLSDTLHQIGSKGLKFTLQPLSMQTGDLVSWAPGDIVVDFSGASSGEGSCSRLENGKIEVIVKPVVSGEHQIQVTYKKTSPILVVPLRCNVTIRNKSPRAPAVARGESVTTTIPEHVNIAEVDRDKLRQMRDITYKSIQSLKESSPTPPPALNTNLDDVLLQITGMVEKMAPLRKAKWKKVILLSPSDFVTFFYDFVTVSVKYYEYIQNNLSLISDPTVQVNLSNSVYRTAALTGKLFNFFQTVLTAEGDRSGFEGDFGHICQSFGEIWTENIGTLTSYLSRAAARESISGIDLSQDPPTIVNALASFLNSEAAAQVSIGDICDNYETPTSLGDSVSLLPSLIQDLLRILKQKEPQFLEVTAGIVKAILFMRLGLLEYLDDSNYNDFVQILNRFNQISIDLLGYKLVRDQVQGDAALQKFSGCLSEISQFLRTVYKE